MKLITISQVPPPRHGSTIMTEHFLRAMEELGHETTLVDRRFSTSVAEVGRFSIRKLASAAWMPFRLLRSIRRNTPEAAVLFVTNRRMSFAVDVALSVVLRATRTPIILYVHTSGWNALAASGHTWRKAAEYVFRIARSVVVLGPALAEDLRKLNVTGKVAVVRNTSNVATSPAPPTPALNVIYVSNLIPAKGVLDFVAVAEQVGASDPAIRFSAYGATSDAAFQATVNERIAASPWGNISYAGPIADATDMSAVLAHADILLFPSTYEFEAQPLTIIEALSCGVPVAAYDVGGVSDIVHNEHGLLASSGDKESMANFVLSMALDRNRLAGKAHAAREFYQHHLSFEAYLSQWSNVLEKAVSS